METFPYFTLLNKERGSSTSQQVEPTDSKPSNLRANILW